MKTSVFFGASTQPGANIMSLLKASATMAAVFVLACAGYASGAVVMYNEALAATCQQWVAPCQSWH
jgi:hypothetical protein